MRILLLLALIVPQIVGAEALVCPSGSLTPVPITVNGPTPNTVSARKAPALAFQATGTGTATVSLEICCLPNCTPASAWAVIENSSMAVAAATPSVAKSVSNPTCNYRANVSACTGCSITVQYSCSDPA